MELTVTVLSSVMMGVLVVIFNCNYILSTSKLKYMYILLYGAENTHYLSITIHVLSPNYLLPLTFFSFSFFLLFLITPVVKCYLLLLLLLLLLFCAEC